MPAVASPVWIAMSVAAVVAGMLLVRVGWSGDRRAAIGGWMLAALGAAAMTVAAGALGLAVATVAATLVALGSVLRAGWTSPARPRRPAREVPSIVLPRRWSGLARRVLVFVLVVPVAFAAAQCAAFGVQAAMRRVGAAEANVIVAALFLQPLLWGAVMTIQMTRTNPKRMIAAPVSVAAIGAMLWVLA